MAAGDLTIDWIGSYDVSSAALMTDINALTDSAVSGSQLFIIPKGGKGEVAVIHLNREMF